MYSPPAIIILAHVNPLYSQTTFNPLYPKVVCEERVNVLHYLPQVQSGTGS